MRYIIMITLGLVLGLSARSAHSIFVGENCSRDFPCVELPSRKMDCSAMNACIARNKAKEGPPKGPGKTRPM